VTRVDRLAHSIRDLQDIAHEFRERGVTLKATEQPIDTRTASGKAFLDMLEVFAPASRPTTLPAHCCLRLMPETHESHIQPVPEALISIPLSLIWL
jgi:hypothetical protein